MATKKIFKRHFKFTADDAAEVSDETKAQINKLLNKFIDNPKVQEISFPKTFGNKDRKLVHDYAQKLGLKSKSRGKEPNRYITVTKVEVNAIALPVQEYRLTKHSMDVISVLLDSHPVTELDRTRITLFSQQVDNFIQAKTRYPCQLNGSPIVPPWNQNYSLHDKRNSLPIAYARNLIIYEVSTHSVTLITGETGCGKTTQVPQFILEEASTMGEKCRIICSMPRRVGAISVSERVALERNEPVGHTVGYQIRLDSRLSPNTALVYCTNGVLLRSLLVDDTLLDNTTHLIMDEIHERDKLCDFILMVLHHRLHKHKNLKVILMSATLDTDVFCRYFKDVPTPGSVCPVIKVPGRLYEVKALFLEEILYGSSYMSPQMEKMKVQYLASKEMETPFYGSKKSKNQSTDQQPSLGVQQPTLEIPSNLKNDLESLLLEVLETGTEQSFEHYIMFIRKHNLPLDYQLPECGRTALMAAASYGNIRYVFRLLYEGASVTPKCRTDKTALDFAEDSGVQNIFNLMNYEFNRQLFEVEMKECHNESSEQPERRGLSPEHETQMKDTLALYEKCHFAEVDSRLIAHVVLSCHASDVEGGILVFLPGFDHIQLVKEAILNVEALRKYGEVVVLPLHSRLQMEAQRKVFMPVKKGQRKVVLSTNIAETSITIDDISFVIDCGKVKEVSYDGLGGVHLLQCNWISKACAQQRRGRAGRTKDGMCFHLFSKEQYEQLSPFQVPEILRVPLQELCLHVKQVAPPDMSIADFLSHAIQSPSSHATSNSIQLLKNMGALTDGEDLTILGQHLVRIPADPKFGKMILYSIMMKCLDPVLTIVCVLSYGDPFKVTTNPDIKTKVMEDRIRLTGGVPSDHLVFLTIFQEWYKMQSKGGEGAWCDAHLISSTSMNHILGTKEQILFHLRKTGFNLSDCNRYSNNWSVIKAAIAAGLYPNIARVNRTNQVICSEKDVKVMVHSSSVLRGVGNASYINTIKSLPTDYIMYEECHKIGPTLPHLRTCTVVSPFTICITAGILQLAELSSTDKNEETQERGQIKVNEFLKFNFSHKTVKLLIDLRNKWNSLVVNRLGLNFNKPRTEEEEAILKTMVEFLSEEDKALGLNPQNIDFFEDSHARSNQRNWRTRGFSAPRGRRGSAHSNGRCQGYPQQQTGSRGIYKPTWKEGGHASQRMDHENYRQRSIANTSHQSRGSRGIYKPTWKEGGHASQRMDHENYRQRSIANTSHQSRGAQTKYSSTWKKDGNTSQRMDHQQSSASSNQPLRNGKKADASNL